MGTGGDNAGCDWSDLVCCACVGSQLVRSARCSMRALWGLNGTDAGVMRSRSDALLSAVMQAILGDRNALWGLAEGCAGVAASDCQLGPAVLLQLVLQLQASLGSSNALGRQSGRCKS